MKLMKRPTFKRCMHTTVYESLYNKEPWAEESSDAEIIPLAYNILKNGQLKCRKTHAMMRAAVYLLISHDLPSSLIRTELLP